MKKTVRIYSRFLSLQNQGQGRVTVDLYNGLKNKYNVIFNGLKDTRKSNYWYAYHLLLGKIFDTRKADYNIALTSMDTLFLNPKKSIVLVMDLIPLISAFEVKTHYNTSLIAKLLGVLLFAITLNKATKFKRIICISTKTKQELITAFPKIDQSKITVIDIGINTKYILAPRQNKKEFVIYTVSAIDNRKRTLELIEWFNQAQLPDDVKLVIGGKGAVYNEALDLAMENKNIRLLGFVSEKDMLGYYHYCDVFVFPSLEEGFGMPIIEAGCCGRPTITLTDGRIPIEVKNTTLVSDWEKLDKDILALKNNPLFWHMRAHQSYTLSKKFQYDYIKEIILELEK